MSPLLQSNVPGLALGSYSDNEPSKGPSSPMPLPPAKTGNTAGLTSAQIDALFGMAPPNGTILVDETNKLYLHRTGGKWHKSAALTEIA